MLSHKVIYIHIISSVYHRFLFRFFFLLCSLYCRTLNAFAKVVLCLRQASSILIPFRRSSWNSLMFIVASRNLVLWRSLGIFCTIFYLQNWISHYSRVLICSFCGIHTLGRGMVYTSQISPRFQHQCPLFAIVYHGNRSLDSWRNRLGHGTNHTLYLLVVFL